MGANSRQSGGIAVPRAVPRTQHLPHTGMSAHKFASILMGMHLLDCAMSSVLDSCGQKASLPTVDLC